MALIKLGNFERCCWPRSNKVTSIGVAAALLTTINASSGHQDFTAKYIIWRLSSYRCSFTLARTSSFLTTYLMLWLHALAVAFLLQWIDRNPFQSLKIPECYNALPPSLYIARHCIPSRFSAVWCSILASVLEHWGTKRCACSRTMPLQHSFFQAKFKQNFKRNSSGCSVSFIPQAEFKPRFSDIKHISGQIATRWTSSATYLVFPVQWWPGYDTYKPLPSSKMTAPRQQSEWGVSTYRAHYHSYKHIPV